MAEEKWGCVIIDSITPLIQPLATPDRVNGRAITSHLLQSLRSLTQSYHVPVIVALYCPLNP